LFLTNESLTLKAKLLCSVVQLISRENAPIDPLICEENASVEDMKCVSQKYNPQVLHGLSFTRSTEWHPT